MSIESVSSRLGELQAMIDQISGSRSLRDPALATQAGFARALASVQPGRIAPAGGASAGTPASFEPLIEQAAAREQLDPAIVRSVIQHESGFDPSATSPAGAQGLMQLMPATAEGLGVTDPYDPAQSIDGGTHLLRQLLDRYGGDLTRALAAYNAGPGAVDRYGGVPPYAETQAYVRNVISTYAQASAGGAP
jgi:soluble lytic murein transglycosylase-like protein